MLTSIGLRASLILLAVPASASSQADTIKKDPTNTLPLVTTRTVRFTTNEGTWMSVDLSPDGRTIVFDLLGDLYTIPSTGGTATRIAGGNSIDVQPRFSPDGKRIVFVSDRSGSDATWVVDADGKNPRQIAPGGKQPAWTPDGQFVIVGNKLIDWRLGGPGVELKGLGSGATFGRDPRYIWFEQGGRAAMYDRVTGEVSNQITMVGGSQRPMVAPDGKSILFWANYQNAMALVQRDLESGATRWILLGTERLPADSPLGSLPGSAWTPDGSAIITSYHGKIWRVAIPSGQATQIPFSAEVEQQLGPLVKFDYRIDDTVQIRQIRDPALSPDGKTVAFVALGKIWTMPLDEGAAPRRLTTNDGVLETSPAWSPDGRSLAFATWFDGAGGDIWRIAASGGPAENLTKAPAAYLRLNFTNDGSRLVFARGNRQAASAMITADARTNVNLELRWMPATGGPQQPITMLADVAPLPAGGFPHFTSDTSRIFFHDGKDLVSIRWNGRDRKVILQGAAPTTLIAPDGRHVVTSTGGRRQVYLFELPMVGGPLTIDPSGERNAPVPARRLSRRGGEFVGWSRDGSRAIWTLGNSLFVYRVAEGDSAVADSIGKALAKANGKPDTAKADTTKKAAVAPAAPADSGNPWAPVYQAKQYPVVIRVPADRPDGVIALRGARLVTMKGNEVIENGDLVITGNRITALGPKGSVAIPADAKVIDVGGKTILPGYVDVYVENALPRQLHRTQASQLLASLAFGVTTVMDAVVQGTDVLGYADREATGDLLGPRLLTTGPAFSDSTYAVHSTADGHDFFGLHATVYRTNGVLADIGGSRADRQNFLKAARELGVTPIVKGKPDFKVTLSEILDGFPVHQLGFEIGPIYGDVAQLAAQADFSYVPTLTGPMGQWGAKGINYFLTANEAPHDDPRIRRFYQHADLDRRARPGGWGTRWSLAEDYPQNLTAQGVATLASRGARVTVGSLGQLPGLGTHWEMWMLGVGGGLTNHELLRAATLAGAQALGLGDQLGSLEVGKLADLQVLDKNPLEDIHQSATVRMVMKNGRLYDANTLDEIAPRQRPLPSLWWWDTEPTSSDKE